MKTPARTGTGESAWQPLTPHGVALFGAASVKRLLLVQLIFALGAAATVTWFLKADWCPAIREAIRQLPPRGEIWLGVLDWPEDSPQVLNKGDFLSFAVDLDHRGAVRSPADLQVEFGRRDVRIFSLFGYTSFGYPGGWIIAFNQTELDPWWGAWEPAILGINAGMVVIGLMAIWAFLSTLYLPLVRLVGFFGDRNLDSRASWRIAGASLMPGALVLTASIGCYGLGLLDVVQLMTAAGIHLVIGWVYLVVSPFFLPRLEPGAAGGKNPFARRAKDKSERIQGTSGQRPTQR